ncbi:hypothetical protein O1L60_29245 [Streptomyces diastatochromogenes]|nr:hypothetical protein [Streptomyces diastatochromogenes]
MTHDDDDRTTFLFYAPGREPHAWALDLTGLGEALRESFPEVRYKVRQDRTHQGEPYLSFWASTDDGTEYDGTATVHGRDCVMLADTTAGEAAPFLLWLRDTYLPAPTSSASAASRPWNGASRPTGGCLPTATRRGWSTNSATTSRSRKGPDSLHRRVGPCTVLVGPARPPSLTPRQNERHLSVKISPVTPTRRIQPTRETPGQASFFAGSRIATHSTWWVIEIMSGSKNRENPQVRAYFAVR